MMCVLTFVSLGKGDAAGRWERYMENTWAWSARLVCKEVFALVWGDQEHVVAAAWDLACLPFVWGEETASQKGMAVRDT